MARHGLEAGASRIGREFVITGHYPDLSLIFDAHLRRPQDMARGMKRYAHAVDRPRVTVGERLDRGFHTHTRAQQRCARPRAKVAFRTDAQVVRMRVGNHGALDRVPRIDVEIPRRTIQTVGIELQEVVHELGQAFPPVQSPCAQD